MTCPDRAFSPDPEPVEGEWLSGMAVDGPATFSPLAREDKEVNTRGLYIHIPFCTRKCLYCDFYSLPGRMTERKAYVDAVLAESKAYAGMSFRTIYFGGGTPSLLGGNLLTKFFSGLTKTFELSHLEEVTVEVNPDSASYEFMKAAADNGINRISVGVQSLNDYELKAAGRIHNASQSLETLEMVQQLGFKSLSADIIAGLPGQSSPSLRRTVESLLDLGVDHISLYCLSLEHGTPMAENPPRNLPSGDEQAEHYETAAGCLRQKGFVHYEISNFARQGHECRHNLNYWRGGEYLGLGPAAASHLRGRRFWNRADLNAYLKDPAGQIEGSEQLIAKEKAAEEAILRLRLLNEGIDTPELALKFGRDNIKDLVNRLHELAKSDKLTADGSRYRLPSSRILTSNPIFAEVLV